MTAVTHPSPRMVEHIQRHLRAQDTLRAFCERVADGDEPVLTGEEFGALCMVVDWRETDVEIAYLEGAKG